MRKADKVRAEFTDLWGRLASFWGISPAAARVFAHLLSVEDGTTAEELCEQLSMSRGAVSTATRELREWGLALPEKRPGSRQVRWRLETDTQRVVKGIVATRKRREWDPILDHVGEWVEELSKESDRKSLYLREQLETVQAIVQLADDMARAFLQGGVIERLGLKLLVNATRRRRRKRRVV